MAQNNWYLTKDTNATFYVNNATPIDGYYLRMSAVVDAQSGCLFECADPDIYGTGIEDVEVDWYWRFTGGSWNDTFYQRFLDVMLRVNSVALDPIANSYRLVIQTFSSTATTNIVYITLYKNGSPVSVNAVTNYSDSTKLYTAPGGTDFSDWSHWRINAVNDDLGQCVVRLQHFDAVTASDWVTVFDYTDVSSVLPAGGVAFRGRVEKQKEVYVDSFKINSLV